MLVQSQIDRRTFLAGLGHGAFAIAIVAIVGCAAGDVVTTAPPSQAASAGTGLTPTGGPAGTPGGAPAGTPTGASTPGSGQGVTWERVNLGFVSAYLLVRGGEAAAYAGAGDIASIATPRPLTVVGDGDRVFDLQIVTSPGHTAGSISVLDAMGARRRRVARAATVAGPASRRAVGQPWERLDRLLLEHDLALLAD